MPTSIPDLVRGGTPDRADGGHDPPSHADDAALEPHTVPVPTQHGPDSAEGGTARLTEPVDGRQDAGMGAGIVEQDDAGGQRERPRGNLQRQHPRDAQPDPSAARGQRRGRRAGQQRYVRREGVREREKEQGPAEAAHQAEARVGVGVEKELQADSDEADDGHCEADGWRWEGEATGELQG